MQGTCAVEDCTRPAEKRGWCGTHYRRWQRHGDPNYVSRVIDPARGCVVEGCDQPHFGNNYCHIHFRRWKKHGDPLLGERRKPQPCAIDGCERRAEVNGWCNAHYKRWKRNGTPTPQPPSEEERFFARVTEGENGCWIWRYQNELGYGLFNPSRQRQGAAHRWAYEFLRAEIPEGLVLDHLCENPSCVNPWHLEPVTQQVNVQRSHHRPPGCQPEALAPT